MKKNSIFTAVFNLFRNQSGCIRMPPRAKKSKMAKYPDFETLLEKLTWCKPNWSMMELTPEASALLHAPHQPGEQLSDKLDELIKRSNAFPIKFPISTVRLEELMKTRPLERLQKNIDSTYPLVHERLLRLMAHFILYKRQHGSNVEKDMYKDMSVPQLIDRILLKRAISFVGPYDKYQLITGELSRSNKLSNWESVGTDEEQPPLVLKDCLSYDEVKLSALLCVSGHTECINNGSRRNAGVPQDDVEENAVIIGCVGPRFQRPGRMDFEEILIPRNGNESWRNLWDTFFEVEASPEVTASSCPLADKAGDERLCIERFVRLPWGEHLFDNEVYYKRIAILAETVLLEAEERAKIDVRPAFVNVVGCGLGVWRTSPHQVDVYVLTFCERVRALLANGAINHVAYVNFSYIQPSVNIADLFKKTIGNETGLFFENSDHPDGGVCMLVEKREPSSKLEGDRARCLIVTMYAWDGNAHPGNEFWWGSLTSSGDPSAACSTQVAELHNAHINPRVRASYTKIAAGNNLRSLEERNSE